ncbi:GNAT family N-acetyltransferase [Embleya sp. NPDC050154]|uniref:GNAT family N-acetyltransferase n=1 Tax=Embleya sp. NPDC050154 TaxID=3363988 RepID=UPI0037B78425
MEPRTTTSADDPALRALWAVAFPDAPGLPALHAHDPGRHERTLVVAADDGAIDAALHWQPRPIRDAAGGVETVGCVGSVASAPRARGRGLIRRLLAVAIDDMTRYGCAWSLMFSGTPGVYTGSGWETFPTPYLRGVAGPEAAWGDRRVRRARPADLPRMITTHAASNANRPLSTVRSPADWAHRFPHWYASPARVLATEQGDYAVIRPDTGEVLELALGPGRPYALPALLREALYELGGPGTVVTLRVPIDTALTRAIGAVLTDVSTGHTDFGLARPIRNDRARVRATVTAPGATHWLGDAF